MDRGAAALRYPRSVTQLYGETGQPEVSQDARAGRADAPLLNHRSSGGRVNSVS